MNILGVLNAATGKVDKVESLLFPSIYQHSMWSYKCLLNLLNETSCLYYQQYWFGIVLLSLTWWSTAPVGRNPKTFSPWQVSSRRAVARDPWWPVRCWLAAPAPSSGWISWRLWGCVQVVSTLKELQLILLGCRCTQFPLALERADDLRSRA